VPKSGSGAAGRLKESTAAIMPSKVIVTNPREWLAKVESISVTTVLPAPVMTSEREHSKNSPMAHAAAGRRKRFRFLSIIYPLYIVGTKKSNL
jgi:hypothetical protein